MPDPRAAPVVPPRLDVRPAAKRYTVLPQRSRLAIYASDSFTGEHKVTFDSWRAHIETEPTLRIEVDIDLDSLHVDVPFADSVVKSRLLEIDKYPHASFVATIARSGGPPGEHLVEGIADLHGVKRGLRVLGTLTQEGESYRFKTVFTISRLWFNIRYGGPMETFFRDEVRIVVDALATPDAPLRPQLPQLPQLPGETLLEVVEDGGGLVDHTVGDHGVLGEPAKGPQR